MSFETTSKSSLPAVPTARGSALGRSWWWLLAALALSGCSLEDPKADLDDLVDRIWMEDWEHQDAIEFLEKGGHCYNDGLEGRTPGVDRDLLLPFLKRIKEENQADPVAILDENDSNWAWAIVIRLPDNSADRKAISRATREMDEKFPGTVDEEWGHEWLSITLLDPWEVEALEEGGIDDE